MWDLVGKHFPFPPEPLALEHTRFVDAGCVRIGIEHRQLESARVDTMHDGSVFEQQFRSSRAQPNPAGAGAQPTGNTMAGLHGVSFHVVARDGGHEYLRFDCFDEHPHYHYLHPWTTPEECDNHCVPWDPVAHGPMTPWALERLRTRLPEMLIEAGGADLAARLDPAETERAVAAVEQIVAEVLAVPAR